MEKFKRLLACLAALVVLAAALLAGCGNAEPSEQQTEKPETSTEETGESQERAVKSIRIIAFWDTEDEPGVQVETDAEYLIKALVDGLAAPYIIAEVDSWTNGFISFQSEDFAI